MQSNTDRAIQQDGSRKHALCATRRLTCVGHGKHGEDEGDEIYEELHRSQH